MGDPHGDPQTNPHGFLSFLKKTIQEIHVDRRVVGWSAGRHVDRPCGGGKFRHGLLEKSLKIAEMEFHVLIRGFNLGMRGFKLWMRLLG